MTSLEMLIRSGHTAGNAFDPSVPSSSLAGTLFFCSVFSRTLLEQDRSRSTLLKQTFLAGKCLQLYSELHEVGSGIYGLK